MAQQVETPTATSPNSATTITETLIVTGTVTVMTGTPTPEISVTAATPTPGVTVVTPTPEPPNVFAAATHSIELTEQAAREGTPTPLPRHIRIATRTPTPRVVTATPTAANSATAIYHANFATAVALTTGTPYVVIATSTPTAFIITPTPRPANVFEAATRKAEQEVQAQSGETPTPLPDNVIIATATPTPRVVTNTPTPANEASATAHAIQATAIAYTTGVPNVITATPTNTPTPRPGTPTAQGTSTTQATSTEQGADTAQDTRTAELPTSTPTRTAPVSDPPILTPESADSPTPTLLPTPASVKRIRFARGAMSATVEGYVDFDQPVRYVLRARADQRMTVELRNQQSDATRVDISTVEGTFLGSANAGETWRGVLPATQDYYLTIYLPAEGAGHDYSLWIEIPP
jgi:hypothetical protein